MDYHGERRLNFYWIWAYLVAIWNVGVTCSHPINWNNCWPPHEWIAPYVQDYIDARKPYAKEREILESMK